jgi:hypothetical protein
VSTDHRLPPAAPDHSDASVSPAPPYRPGDRVIVDDGSGRERRAVVRLVMATDSLSPDRRWRIDYRFDDDPGTLQILPAYCAEDGTSLVIRPADS